jgi:hypothetical protein
MPSMRWLIVVTALSAATCSADGGSPADSGPLCPVVDLCAVVSIAELASVCGITADGTYDSAPEAGTPAARSAPVVGTVCDYQSKGIIPFQVSQACYKEGARLAKILYNQEHDSPQEPITTQEDLSGVGDSAFYRYTEARTEGALYVLKGNLLVSMSDYAGTGSDATKLCMTTIAQQVLAAN